MPRILLGCKGLSKVVLALTLTVLLLTAAATTVDAATCSLSTFAGSWALDIPGKGGWRMCNFKLTTGSWPRITGSCRDRKGGQLFSVWGYVEVKPDGSACRFSSAWSNLNAYQRSLSVRYPGSKVNQLSGRLTRFGASAENATLWRR